MVGRLMLVVHCRQEWNPQQCCSYRLRIRVVTHRYLGVEPADHIDQLQCTPENGPAFVRRTLAAVPIYHLVWDAQLVRDRGSLTELTHRNQERVVLRTQRLPHRPKEQHLGWSSQVDPNAQEIRV